MLGKWFDFRSAIRSAYLGEWAALIDPYRLKALARWKRGWGLGECLPRGRWKTLFELGDPRQCNGSSTNKQTISDCSRKSKERSSTGFNSFLPPGKAVYCLRFPGSLIFFLITRAGEYHTAISWKCINKYSIYNWREKILTGIMGT